MRHRVGGRGVASSSGSDDPAGSFASHSRDRVPSPQCGSPHARGRSRNRDISFSPSIRSPYHAQRGGISCCRWSRAKDTRERTREPSRKLGSSGRSFPPVDRVDSDSWYTTMLFPRCKKKGSATREGRMQRHPSRPLSSLGTEPSELPSSSPHRAAIVRVAVSNASQLSNFGRNEEPSLVAPSALLNCPSPPPRRFVASLSGFAATSSPPQPFEFDCR